MKNRVEWLSEEEGRIFFYEKEMPFLTMEIFLTGEEEAELKIQDMVFESGWEENDKMQQEVILKVTKCISESFRLLWEEGYEETILVEQNSTKTAEILNSTGVVNVAYKEYMMKRHFEQQNSTDCGRKQLSLTKNEEGYLCENKAHTFCCRLLEYESGEQEESCFYLYEVEVSKKHRNKGIATACLKELFQSLWSTSPGTIYLQVGSYNKPAVHLYEKLGFEVCEELCYYAMTEQ